MTKLETPNVAADAAKSAPWRTATALALLQGVGCGIALALLSLVNGMLVSQTSGQLFELFHSKMDSRRAGTFTYGEMRRLKSANGQFAEAAAYSPVPLTLKSGNWESRVNGSFVTDGYFTVIRSRFVAGQSISCNEPSAAIGCFQVLLSQQFWQQRFASDPSIVGRLVSIDDRDFLVRGVVASEFPPVEIDRDPQLWISTQVEPDLLGFNWLDQTSNVRWLLPIVRIRPEAGLARATAGVKSLLGKPTFETGDNDFLLLTPGQAKVARTFRVRGQIVRWFGARVTLVFWFFLLLWSIIANLIAILKSRWHFSVLNLVALSLAASVIAGCVSFIASRSVISFLRHFGVAAISQQSGFDRRSFLFLILILAGGSLFAYGCQQVLQRSGRGLRSHGVDNEGFSAVLDVTAVWWAAVKDQRYIVLSGFLVTLVAGFTYNGIYGTDFWHHAAVVRELATHPLHPQNPILPLAAPHEGFSPYGLLGAFICRVTGLSAVDALIVMGFVNLLLLLFALRAFVRAAFPAKHTDFYALLLMLVLWGTNPWMLSGFLHLNYLIRGTAYPSTFAIAVTFLAWYVVVLTARGRTRWLLLVLLPLVTTVFLVHPMTAGSMIIGCVVLTFGFTRTSLPVARVVAICIAGFLPALAWPYYPFRTLIFTGSAHFDATNVALYSGAAVLGSMLFLAITGVPLLFLRFRANRRDFLVIMFCCFTLVYIFGGVSGKFVLGRVMFFMVFMLQLAVADWLARNETGFDAHSFSAGRTWFRNLVFISAAAGCVTMLPGFISAVPIFQNSYDDYAFLPGTVGQYDTVLSDFSTGQKIPAIAGKVVSLSPDQVMLFVDHTSAEKDVQNFFGDAKAKERIGTLRRYGVSFVLLNKYKTDEWPSILLSLHGIASISYGDGDMLLLQIVKQT